MLYDPTLVQPMRDELTSIGFKELTTSLEVEDVFSSASGTSLLLVNSVCGCAAGQARPGIALALTNSNVPDNLYTVFAGQDTEATSKARGYMHGFAPSSPSIGLFKDGQLVRMIERFQIEGSPAEDVAQMLVQAFEEYCS